MTIHGPEYKVLQCLAVLVHYGLKSHLFSFLFFSNICLKKSLGKLSQLQRLCQKVEAVDRGIMSKKHLYVLSVGFNIGFYYVKSYTIFDCTQAMSDK